MVFLLRQRGCVVCYARGREHLLDLSGAAAPRTCPENLVCNSSTNAFRTRTSANFQLVYLVSWLPQSSDLPSPPFSPHTLDSREVGETWSWDNESSCCPVSAQFASTAQIHWIATTRPSSPSRHLTRELRTSCGDPVRYSTRASKVRLVPIVRGAAFSAWTSETRVPP